MRGAAPREPRPLVAIGWAGMRGAVSLALALPRHGDISPARGLIVYLTFCVILFTLVGQGLTLAPLLRGLGIAGDGRNHREELEARELLLEKGPFCDYVPLRYGKMPVAT